MYARYIPARVVLAFILALALSGCAEYSYRLTELYGMNCRPEALQQGQCVTAKRATP